MTFYTRIPFLFWLLMIPMSLITWGVLSMPETPISAFLVTCITLYWGATIILIGLAFLR